MAKTIAVIPARGGSKRLPKKNILDLNGKPLIAHSILYALAQKEIDDVYVSTNDPAIKTVALTFGAKVIDRPEAISGDHEPTITSVQHVLERLDFDVDQVVLLQATNPLRPKSLFTNAFKHFLEQQTDCLFTVTRNHDKLGHIQNNRFIPFNYTPGQRSQDLKPLFFENGLLYITKASAIKKGFIISETGFPFEVSHPFASVDIDTAEDFEYANFVLKTYHHE
ncbi:cytidylyltransferase domain-containing protein [Psychroserpens sp.]|uniref:acylneuraminate cytidylyltransferase family protein n=1 Tax=Psychroserpens sp. TaxID=2020870 RepID=UPI003C723C76